MLIPVIDRKLDKLQAYTFQNNFSIENFRTVSHRLEKTVGLVSDLDYMQCVLFCLMYKIIVHRLSLYYTLTVIYHKLG